MRFNMVFSLNEQRDQTSGRPSARANRVKPPDTKPVPDGEFAWNTARDVKLRRRAKAIRAWNVAI
jgi:hypothetical protein